MKMSSRELILGWSTLAILLIGGTLWLGAPLFGEWRSFQREQKELRKRISGTNRLLKQQDGIHTRLEELQTNMPSYPVSSDVTSQLLKTLQKAADQHGLILLRQEPESETQVGELYEMSIGCNWEGSLPALIRFLYELQAQGAMVDVRQLTVNPSRSGTDKLKGLCKIDYAYSRHEPEPAPDPQQPD